jgi:hypothetical protein|tara:strand:+ start:8244 stop:8642 length:399 start_codon:yes stop_codon:yes gene_type:complete
METKKDILNRLFVENNLTSEDVFSHQHYKIITRAGIDKIQANVDIQIIYDVIRCESNFAVVKAKAKMGDKQIETFGSALKGANYQDGNTNTWYVMEMAEKRAMSRAVLKLAGFYELGVFGEDESESFKRNNN